MAYALVAVSSGPDERGPVPIDATGQLPSAYLMKSFSA